MEIDISKIKVGDIFSEESHYKVTHVGNTHITFDHLESNTSVTISINYVADCLNTCGQYNETVEVTKEDKKDGTPGIRSIFENIKTSEVFTVVFRKQDTVKTKKQLREEKEAQRTEAIALIDRAKKQKKSMAEAYKEALGFIQDNPITETIKGEIRTLRGFKLQFTSRDGKYRCLDMDVERTEKETGERLVNINTIEELVYNGTKYIVKP